jgi:WD40 repeat protein
VQTLSLPELRPLTTTDLTLPPDTRFTHAWLSPSGNVAVMIRDDDRADVLNLSNNRPILSLAALPGALAAVDRRDERLILLDGQHNELVDLSTGTPTLLRERARFCRGQWFGARFSDDGKLAVAGASCGEVFAWNGHTGKLVRRVTLPGQITGLAMGHDGRTVAVASPDGRITLIDLTTGSRRSIPGPPRGINSLDFGAGDRVLAAGVDDGTVRIWDTANGRLLRELPLQQAAAVRFTPDGRRLMTIELNGVLRLFDACPGCGDAHALLGEAARRATRQLTPAERETYLSGF